MKDRGKQRRKTKNLWWNWLVELGKKIGCNLKTLGKKLVKKTVKVLLRGENRVRNGLNT